MLQSGEIIIILLLALIVLGPQRLPDMARKLGRWANELRAAASEITKGLEAEVADIKELGNELKAPLDDVKKPFTDIRDEMSNPEAGHPWTGPKPVSGPTPQDAMDDLRRMQREEDAPDTSSLPDSEETSAEDELET